MAIRSSSVARSASLRASHAATAGGSGESGHSGFTIASSFGTRPDTTKVHDLVTHFRKALPEVVTVAQDFKQHGWQSEAMGKIFHGGYDDPPSWSVPSFFPKTGRNARLKPAGDPDAVADPGAAPAKKAGGKAAPKMKGLPWESPDVPDSTLADGMIADHAIERLRANKDRPFFLAVGFIKPHLPFIAPKKYWDLYDPAVFQLADNPQPPKNAPSWAGTAWGELRAYTGMPKSGPLSDEQARSMIHGYHAAISFMDAQVGRVLAELNALGLRENTIIVLWGDHGWHLGDHGFWCKHTNYEHAARAPLIVSAPGQKTAGQKSAALVEFVDIYPSLCDLAGVPKPDTLEGTSFVPLLTDPQRPWKKAAFSQYPRGIALADGTKAPGMGHALATDRYRFVEWTTKKDAQFSECELYDHQTDSEENMNIANDPANAKLVAELKALLHGGWRGALPPAGK